MSIAQNTALFSLLGTTYGGNGQTNFALPDLRGRSPLAQGQGPGLSPYALGEVGGLENVTLTTINLPSHTHQVNAATDTSGVGTQVSPSGGVPAIPGAARGLKAYNTSSVSQVSMNAAAVSPTGGSMPHSNMAPYAVVTFIIALQGIYPSRN